MVVVVPMAMIERLGRLFRRKRPAFRVLELHVAHGCNLRCESCSHYSNHGHSGIVSLEEADRWMGLWSRRVSVTMFNLLGGEPTIHPELPRFIGLVRRHWPRAHIGIVSNGFSFCTAILRCRPPLPPIPRPA